MTHENAEVERLIQRMIEAERRAAETGYPMSAEAIRAQVNYLYQLGRFDGRVAGIKEMSDLAR